MSLHLPLARLKRLEPAGQMGVLERHVLER